jgi:hypothetical protein
MGSNNWFSINSMPSTYKIKKATQIILDFLCKEASSSLLMKPKDLTTSSK